MTRRFLTGFCATLAVGGCAGQAGPTAAAVPPASIFEGVYAAAQAEQGDVLYAGHCAMCHSANYAGTMGGPALKGPAFRFGWKGKPVKELYDFIRANMPPGQTGTMSEDEYLAVTAAVLEANGYPASAAGTSLAAEILSPAIVLENSQ